MLQFYKCFFGQMLSILIAIAVTSQDTLTQKHAKYSFFVLYAPVYIVIFTVSQIYILINKPQPTKKIHFYRFFICGCLDFLGGYFLNKSFAQTSPCLIVFLTQMIYPLSAFTELFIFTKVEHKKKYQKLLKKLSKKLLIFAVLSCACFIVNYKQEGSSFRFSYSGILYVILSDIFYMSNTFCQSFIVPHTGAYLYLRNFSFSGFVYCIAICVVDIKSFDVSFYKTYYTYIIFYTLSLSLFYIFASPYINKFGGIVFNSSVITGSVYCGIYKMISTEMKKKNSTLFMIFQLQTSFTCTTTISKKHLKHHKLNPGHTDPSYPLRALIIGGRYFMLFAQNMVVYAKSLRLLGSGL